MPFVWATLLVLAFVLFWRRGRSDRAKTILAERYARGEISVEEYRDRLAQLGRKN